MTFVPGLTLGKDEGGQSAMRLQSLPQPAGVHPHRGTSIQVKREVGHRRSAPPAALPALADLSHPRPLFHKSASFMKGLPSAGPHEIHHLTSKAAAKSSCSSKSATALLLVFLTNSMAMLSVQTPSSSGRWS